MVSHESMIGFARSALGLPEEVSLECEALSARGSDRTFHRVALEDGNGSYILIHYDPARVENAYYADLTDFLALIGVPAPLLIQHDPVHCLLLMEDLGNADLWSFRDAPWEERSELYRKTLFVAHRLHSFPVDEFPGKSVKLMESFGPHLYRWERDYFKEHFVRGALRIEMEPALEEDLEKELFSLAERLSGTGYCLVHRDFQSQNVMIRGGEPYLIDFQGMRFGSPFYDLGSLLMDPYVNFSREEVDDLLSFAYDMEGGDLDWGAFQAFFWEASVQRLMQALGAYGFLGYKRGLTSFLAHIPAGLANLGRAVEHAATLPRLNELLISCRTKWQSQVDLLSRDK